MRGRKRMQRWRRKKRFDEGGFSRHGGRNDNGEDKKEKGRRIM